MKAAQSASMMFYGRISTKISWRVRKITPRCRQASGSFSSSSPFRQLPRYDMNIILNRTSSCLRYVHHDYVQGPLQEDSSEKYLPGQLSTSQRSIVIFFRLAGLRDLQVHHKRCKRTRLLRTRGYARLETRTPDHRRRSRVAKRESIVYGLLRYDGGRRWRRPMFAVYSRIAAVGRVFPRQERDLARLSTRR